MQRFKVPEMHCEHCVETLDKAIKSLDPAAKVAIDLATKTVVVVGKVDPAAIARGVAQAGYTYMALVT